MKQKLLQLFTVIWLVFGLSALQAQTAIVAAGANATGSGGTLSYSVGQVFYSTSTGTNGSVAAGVQQPFEISTLTGIDEAEGITLSATAYPNPTTDYLMLEVKDFDFSTLHFQLFDVLGKVIQSNKITDNQTKVFMSNLTPANYFLKVIQGNKELKTFKIIKN